MFSIRTLSRMDLSMNPEQNESIYPIRTRGTMDLCIILEPVPGLIYVTYQNPEQNGTMYPIRTRSRMDLCTLLEP